MPVEDGIAGPSGSPSDRSVTEPDALAEGG